jgi:catechol 2,3-dioxygenase-like lactoylglutathione lyase family enzyme
MPYIVNHIHIKVPDPGEAVDWWAKAFNLKVVSDIVRDSGDRFIRCESEGGLRINISGQRSGEKMGRADANAHWGLEHFGFDSEDIDADISRLQGLGAELLEGPNDAGDVRIAFLKTPGGVRIELIEPVKM